MMIADNPLNNTPTITEYFRLTLSAKDPVGISNMNADIATTEIIMDIWKKDRFKPWKYITIKGDIIIDSPNNKLEI